MDLEALKAAASQFLKDVMPGGSLSAEWTPERTEMARAALGFVPVVGDALSLQDTVHDVRAGDYKSAALNAAGLLPFVPGVTKTARAAQKVLQSENLAPKYTKAQRAALGDYVYDSLSLNHALSTGAKLTPQQEKQYLALMGALNKHGITTTEPTFLYRGVNSPDSGKAFISATPDPDIAKWFGDVKRVEIPAGSKVLPVTGDVAHPSIMPLMEDEFGNQKILEFILPPGFKAE